MQIDLIARGKRHDVPGLDDIDANFTQLFTDVRALVMALKAKRINLASADDVVGTLAPVDPVDPVASLPPGLNVTRRKYVGLYYNAVAVVAFGLSNPTGIGSNYGIINDASPARSQRGTSGPADNAIGGLASVDPLGYVGRFVDQPDYTFNIFTGPVITACQIWVGLFDHLTPSVAPGTDNAGVLLRAHAAVRYAPNGGAGDTTWVASAADGATQTIAALGGGIAPSTHYVVRVRFSSNVQIQVSVNGGAEAVLVLATAAADQALLTWGVFVVNDGVTVDHRIEIASLDGTFF